MVCPAVMDECADYDSCQEAMTAYAQVLFAKGNPPPVWGSRQRQPRLTGALFGHSGSLADNEWCGQVRGATMTAVLGANYRALTRRSEKGNSGEQPRTGSER